MKIYTLTYDANYPSPGKFWTAPNSDFKIGLKVIKDGEELEEVKLLDGDTEIEADEDKTAGFTTFYVKSGEPGAKAYSVKATGVAEPFKLTHVTTDSTVFDVGGEGGGGVVPADVATKTWVNEQISSFVDEDELTAYATNESLTSYATKRFVEEKGYLTAVPDTYKTYDATKSSLSADGYATETWVSSKISSLTPTLPADISANSLQIKNNSYTVISASAGAQDDSGTLLVNGTAASLRVGTVNSTGSVRINSNGTTPSIEGGKGSGTEPAYSLSCDSTGHGILTLNTTTLNATELQSMKDLSGNVYAKADTLSSSAYGEAPKTASIQTVYETDWETLSASAVATTFYVVLPDPE